MGRYQGGHGATRLHLETQAQTELELARVGGGGGEAEVWQSGCTGAEDVVGKLEICTVKYVEAFGQCLDMQPLGQTESSAQAQIERVKVKPLAGIPAEAHRTIVNIRIEVAIVSRHHIKRQRRTVAEDVTQLPAVEGAPEKRRRLAPRRGEGAAHGQEVTLVVIGRALVVPQVEIILRRKEEGVARIVGCSG